MDKPINQLESEFDRAVSLHEGSADGTVVPIAGPRRSHETLRERERWFRQVLSALPAAVYTTDAGGRLTFYNDAAAEIWGQRPQIGGTEWCGSWKLFWPDGTPMEHGDCPMAIALKEDRAVRGMEAVCERPDGTRVPFIPYPTPLHDEAGRLVGAVNMLVDIGERKRAEERQHLMVRELHHRVKNTLATVQAIMGSTARSATSIDDFQNALIGRIGALAKTHVLLSEDGPVTFEDILHSELGAFDDGTEDRIRLTGPSVEIPTQLAVTLGLAVHELTANAVKHGALSEFGGKVDVSWSETIEANRRRLDFEWVESGGPKVLKPKRKGFGVRMLEFVLPGQIQATTAIEYKPKGVRLRCSVPLPSKVAE